MLVKRRLTSRGRRTPHPRVLRHENHIVGRETGILGTNHDGYARDGLHVEHDGPTGQQTDKAAGRDPDLSASRSGKKQGEVTALSQTFLSIPGRNKPNT